jgi:hypothetical protein
VALTRAKFPGDSVDGRCTIPVKKEQNADCYR